MIIRVKSVTHVHIKHVFVVYQMASPLLLYSLHTLLEQDSELQLSCIFL